MEELEGLEVFKFGGASVKSAEAVRNVHAILASQPNKPRVVIISAMGKTTNALEEVVELAMQNDTSFLDKLDEVAVFHRRIIDDLFEETRPSLEGELALLLQGVKAHLEARNRNNHDYLYDQVIALGELYSTTIISHYLNAQGLNNQWFDARKLVKTDYRYREAQVDWVRSSSQIQQSMQAYFSNSTGSIAITQGFIGGADSLNATTLGREGSDYSAAIFAYALGAESVSIWKDVPGVLNADPRKFEHTQQLAEISFREAIELAYYGASVIHPKTIKPLQNRNIPLWVKSFVNWEERGTLISQNTDFDAAIPSFISKGNQQLISFSARDFSFIVEEHLSELFNHFSACKVHVNMMQNSAINFTICADESAQKFEALRALIQPHYEVRYNSGLELLTIRHYDEATIGKLTAGKQKFMEQRTRHTYRVVLGPTD